MWILKTLLQVAYFILALWIGITRINDYVHHPEDVIMGSIIGIMCAFLMHRKEHKIEEHKKDKQTDILMATKLHSSVATTKEKPLHDQSF